PLPRNAKMLTAKQTRAGKVGPTAENVNPEKEENCYTKRSSSSPQGGPKKRSAFGDITNARKNQTVAGKKEPVKVASKAQKAQGALGVAKNNEINLKKSMKKTPPTAPAEPEVNSVPEKPVQEVPAVEDIDKEQLNDPYASAEYAKDIFEYMREREEKFLLPDYMDKQLDITGDMRAILVDWMVEVQ
ncbi:CCNB3 protein, partial [Scytalopus superciliaris]|nr:CCNB3 protein [Scytalopus superciliaris]